MKKVRRIAGRHGALLLLLCCLLPTKQVRAGMIDESFPKETLISRINTVKKISGIRVAYDDKDLRNIEVAALTARKNTAEEVLQMSLRGLAFNLIKNSESSFVIVKKAVKEVENNTVSASLSGIVLDENGQPVGGASVTIPGTTLGAMTDMDGHYVLRKIPAGTHKVQFNFISYETQQISGVQITTGKITRLDVVMKEASNQLSEVVVTTEYSRSSNVGLLARQRESIAMIDGISAEQMKQTSDNNMAQVLKRVSGVTVQDNKFVVVRGMSERYNNVQLNGSSMPSTEPNRRNFSFDVLPSNIIDNVVVAKTFTPDMPADFTGGSVQIQTISIPEKKFISLSAGTGFNSQSTGKDFYSNTRYKGDYFLGTDARDWFKNGWSDDYKAVYVEPQNTNYEPTTEMNAVMAKLPNHWGLQKFKGAPTQSYSLSAGIPFRVSELHSLGVVGALTYRHEESREDYDWRSRYSPEIAYDGIKNTFSTSVAALLNFGWKYAGHRITWKNLYNRRFTHDNSRQTEYEPGTDSTLLNYYTRKIVSSPRDNTLWQTRLDGEHRLWRNRLVMTWFGDYNKLNRSQPDDRFNQGYVSGTLPDGREVIGWYTGYSTNPISFDQGGLFASELEETKWNAGGNMEYSFAIDKNRQKLKTGYWGTFRNAGYSQISTYVYAAKTYGNVPPLQELYAPERFASGDLYFKILRMGIGDLFGGDNYTGSQDIHAMYLMGDFRMFKERLQVSGGVRTEDSRMEVNTITRIHASLWIDTTMVYRERRWLPALNISYDILSSLKARVSYGRTLARPDFRERSAFQYYDLWERATIRGNGGLEDSFIDNYDLRLEYYPSPGEIFSISAFYKDFTKPVEIVTIGTNGEDMVMYVNMISAEAKGVELNLRKHFGFVSPSLQRLFVSGNATLLKGNVRFNGSEIDGIYTIYGGYRNRPPMGLSPLSYNAGISWEENRIGVAINYGYVGRKIRYAGANEFLDEYEAPRSTLDAQLSMRLAKGKMEIKLNVSDLLAEPYIIYRNAWKYVDGQAYEQFLDGTWDYEEDKDTALRKSWKGRTFSASVSWKF